MTPSETFIRTAEAGDIARLRRIEKAARQRYRGLSGFEHIAEVPPIGEERFDGGETLVASLQGTAIGFVLLQIVDGSLYVANISVLPQASGRAVGRGLLAAAESRASEVDAAAVTLATFKVPRWNGPWFRRLGYQTMPEGQIGPELRAILKRQATFADPSLRETLWKQIDGPVLPDHRDTS